MREVTAYNWVPDFAQGFVKDLRVRWALEEANMPYSERLIDHTQKLEPEHLARQPFAQVPVYRDDVTELFESGAVVMWIAGQSEALMPTDIAARARILSWAFAALNSIEPFVANVTGTELFHGDAPWAEGYLETAREALSQRLKRLSGWLNGREYLETDQFTAADLLMASVLRELERGGTLARFPDLEAYCRRCVSRPAFERALRAQMGVFEAHQPA